jgi:hypothetical protein
VTDDQPFDGMPSPTTPTKITFVGVRADSAAAEDVFRIGDTHEFKVTGEIVHLGPEKMADGHIRQLVKVAVDSVEPLSFTEPKVSPVEDDDAGDDGPRVIE